MLVYGALHQVFLLARHSCCSSGCTFPKWDMVLQEGSILQCHVKCGCFASFHSREAKKPPVFGLNCATWSPLLIYSSDHLVGVIKNWQLSAFSGASLIKGADSVSRCSAMMETRQKQVLWFPERRGGDGDDDRETSPFTKILESFCQIPQGTDHSGGSNSWIVVGSYPGEPSVCRR